MLWSKILLKIQKAQWLFISPLKTCCPLARLHLFVGFSARLRRLAGPQETLWKLSGSPKPQWKISGSVETFWVSKVSRETLSLHSNNSVKNIWSSKDSVETLWTYRNWGLPAPVFRPWWCCPKYFDLGDSLFQQLFLGDLCSTDENCPSQHLVLYTKNRFINSLPSFYP